MIKLANKIALASLLGAEEGMEKKAAVKMLSRLRPLVNFPVGHIDDPLTISMADKIDSYVKGAILPGGSISARLPGSIIQPETRNILAKRPDHFQPYLKYFADSTMNKLTAEKIIKSLVDRYGVRYRTDDLLKRDIVNKLKDITHRRFMQAAAKNTPEAWRRHGTAVDIENILSKNI